MFFQVYRISLSALIITIILLGLVINCVTSRSIDPDNLTVDKSEVPARYVFEIDEVEDELSEMNKNRLNSQDRLNSSLMFDMPIAVAIFAAVMLLVCCFCCLRCAVTYDGYKRGGFYGKSKNRNVVDIVRGLKTVETIKN